MSNIGNFKSEYIEGELYEIIEIEGHRFEIICGYNTNQDKITGFVMPIYPDFLKEPKYTKLGYPLASCSQNICEYYKRLPECDNEGSCIDCYHFEREPMKMIGVCKCRERRME